MKLLDEIMQRAKNDIQHIVLPEGTEIRTLKAADIILKEKAAKLTLLGNKDEIQRLATDNKLENIHLATIIDPENDAKATAYAELLYDLRKDKGLQMEDALKLVKDPLYYGCLMIKNDDDNHPNVKSS